MKVNQDQGSSNTWAPRVELGLLGTSWASRVGQVCVGLLGRGGAGCEAVELSSSEQCWAPREQQIRSRAQGEGVPGGQGSCASSQPGPGAELGSGWGWRHWQGAAAREASWLFSHQGWLLLGP